jgi:hypothetical protein
MNRMTSPTPRDLFALSAVSMSGAVLMAAIAWAHMRALDAAYGQICGQGGEFLAHCPACPGAVAFAGVGALSLGLAQAARRRVLHAQA